MLASLTTQGMNRYIYTENDPVNVSDPTGTVIPMFALAFGAFFVGAIIGGFVASQVADSGVSIGDWLLRGGMMASLGAGSQVARNCQLQLQNADKILTGLLAAGLMSIETYLGLMLRTFFGFLGVAFAAGFVVGFAATSFVLMADAGYGAGHLDERPLCDDRNRRRPIVGDVRLAMARACVVRSIAS